MNARVPLPHPDNSARDGSRGHAPQAGDHEDARRHGNAASGGADDGAHDTAQGTRRDFGLRLSPEQAPQGAASSWTPRALTVEELRARFREQAREQSRVVPGHQVDRLGRRLTDFDLDEQEERQRMPQPIPVAWQSPVMPRSPSALSRHMGSGLLGLALGLAITVPGVLWYKGRIDPMAMVGLSASDLGLAVAAPSKPPVVEERQAVAEVRRTVVAPVDVVRSVVPSAATSEKVEPVATASAPPSPPPAPVVVPREEPAPAPVAVLKPVPSEIVTSIAPPQPPPVRPEVAMLEDARRLIGDGDFVAARKVLEDRLLTTTPEARFLLAETYDPNFLAARGIRSVRAEVPRAVELYREALSGGIEAARQRLTGLRP